MPTWAPTERRIAEIAANLRYRAAHREEAIWDEVADLAKICEGQEVAIRNLAAAIRLIADNYAAPAVRLPLLALLESIEIT